MAESSSSIALGLALGLTSATQLRAPFLPVGPGEVLLAMWLCAALVSLARQRQFETNPLVKPFLVFWLLTLAALALGWCSGLYLNVWDNASTRDAFAVLLAAGVVMVSSVQRRAAQRLWLASGALSVTLVVGLGVLLALSTMGRPVLGPINSLYGFRFAGWALNPNQTALAVSVVPFFAIERRNACEGRVSRLGWTVVALVALVVGIATLSDALMLGWGVAAAIIGGKWWALTTFVPGNSRSAKRIAIFAVPLVVVGAIIAAGPRIIQLSEATAESSYQSNGQGADRVARWKHGLDAAARAPVFGLGPGSYSGPFSSFQGEEAHNTPIDWLDSTGVVGLLALLGLWSWVAWRVASMKRKGAGIALSALLSFAMFHFVLRQPVFWFLLLALAASPPTIFHASRRVGG